jgi:type IV fimbrial biogenesis protein FimT
MPYVGGMLRHVRNTRDVVRPRTVGHDGSRDDSGFTLWELMCTLTVLGVVLASAGPAVQSFILDARRTAAVNAFVSAVQLARAESARQGREVVLCPTDDTATCTDVADGSGQWMLFAVTDAASPPQLAADRQPLLILAPIHGVDVLSNRSHYAFRPFQRRSTNGTITFCDRRGNAGARAIIISYTGRPRTTEKQPNGQALSCPGWRP